MPRLDLKPNKQRAAQANVTSPEAKPSGAMYRTISVPSSLLNIAAGKSDIMYEDVSQVETLTGHALSHVQVKITRSGSVMTPHWFWPYYMDRQTMPQEAAAELSQVVDEEGAEQSLELPSAMSTHSKLSLIRNRDIECEPRVKGTGVVNLSQSSAEKSVLNIMDISRQRKRVPAVSAFTEHSLDLLRREQRDANQVPRNQAPYTLHDFEVYWQPFKPDEMHSISHIIRKELGCPDGITSVEMLREVIRKFWLENLEIQIETKFFYVDNYLFTYHATHYAHCINYTMQVPANKVQMSILRRLYDWMIAENDGMLVDEYLVPIFIAADFLGITQLTQQYLHMFSQSGDTGMAEQNIFHAYLYARTLRSDSMMQVLVQGIRKTFLPLVASSEFLEMDANEVALLLRQDRLSVNSEDEVFFAGVRWLEHNWSQREKDVGKVMASVRFQHMSPWLLRSMVNMAENEVISAVANAPEVTAYMWNAAKYCLAAVIDKDAHKRSPHLKKYHQYSPCEREWAYCPGLVHHHDLHCRHYRELTYETFKLLLIRLQLYGPRYADSLMQVPNKIWQSYKCCDDYNPKAPRDCQRAPWYIKELNHTEFH